MSSESSSSDENEDLSWWDERLQRIKENDPRVKLLIEPTENFINDIQNMTDEEWEELGRDVSNNTHLTEVDLGQCDQGALNDHQISCLFRGLTRSSSLQNIAFYNNGLSAAGVRSMVPFLQNAHSLTALDLDQNYFQSEGFNVLLRALRDSPIEELLCSSCGIESIEIDSEHAPKQLKRLFLNCNSINADGCTEVAKLLQGGNATLERLYLRDNKIDDEGVEILTNALRSNTSLTGLDLRGNVDISDQGQTMLLKLVNDISSIEATLQSNHKLEFIFSGADLDRHIRLAMKINKGNRSNLEAGREKVVWTQLHSETRAQLAEIQGVNHSLYSEINPLHLPGVLELVGRCHGLGELYIALKSSMAFLISTENKKECIRQQMAYHKKRMAHHAEKLEELGTKLAAIEAADESATLSFGSESRSFKKRRAR